MMRVSTTAEIIRIVLLVANESSCWRRTVERAGVNRCARACVRACLSLTRVDPRHVPYDADGGVFVKDAAF